MTDEERERARSFVSMSLGALIGALLELGTSREEIRLSVETAFTAADMREELDSALEGPMTEIIRQIMPIADKVITDAHEHEFGDGET